MRLAFLIFLGVLCCLAPRKEEPAPKREFRGVWIATFANLDWPSRSDLDVATQKKEFEQLLDRIRATGFNAVLVQVRPAGDAFYPSPYEPWSAFLAGEQGKDPGYDPMAFMVEAAHARNLEFHAWINPFRAVSHIKFSQVAKDHLVLRHPHWFITYGNSRYFNPGVPGVRDYLSCVVLDIAQRYDIDGIHFDDYFYPYPIPGKNINDLSAYAHFRGDHTSISEWRRSNVDAFVQQVSDSLQRHVPHIKFGISPPAVWRNKREDARGSETTADLAAYDHLYADTRKWLQEGWVDYLAPQCYHHSRFNKARFPKLASWWGENAGSRHVYIGHAAYKVKEGRWPAWRRKAELPDQLQMARAQAGIRGSILYRAGSFVGNPRNLESELREHMYRNQALPPPMPWKDSVAPLPPAGLRVHANQLRWRPGPLASDGETAHRYAIYRFPDDAFIDLNKTEYLIGFSRSPEFTDPAPLPEACTYAITALDRLSNESEPVMERVHWNAIVQQD